MSCIWKEIGAGVCERALFCAVSSELFTPRFPKDPVRARLPPSRGMLRIGTWVFIMASARF